jgi:hypothetical protein
MKVKEIAVATLVVSLTLGSLPAHAQETAVVVDRAAIEQALSSRAQADVADRDAIRTLLRRDDVRAMVGDLGVDLRRVDSAVATLDGRDLQNTAARARAAHEMLSGGAQTIQISVVTLLLIIIIVILLAD